jgi:hypothetical protein
MAKEEKKEEGKKKPARKHLVQIRSERAEDGSWVHHHTYKAKKSDHHTEPERQNVATSENAEEAGQHVAEQGQMAEQADAAQPESDPGAAAAPDAGAAPAAGAGAMPGA